MKKLWLMSALVLNGLLGAQTLDESENLDSPKQEKTISIDERAKRETDRAEKSLGLSAEQKTKWQAAALTRITANSPLKEKYRNTQSETEKRQLKQQMRSNAKQFDDTVNGFLTAEQKIKWASTKQERKEHRRHRMDQHTK